MNFYTQVNMLQSQANSELIAGNFINLHGVGGVAQPM
jgi:hypothetical protein